MHFFACCFGRLCQVDDTGDEKEESLAQIGRAHLHTHAQMSDLQRTAVAELNRVRAIITTHGHTVVSGGVCHQLASFEVH